MQAYKTVIKGRKGTRRTSHLLDKQLEVASRYDSNEGDGERDGSGYEYLRWDHPRLCAVCCVLAGDQWNRPISSCGRAVLHSADWAAHLDVRP